MTSLFTRIVVLYIVGHLLLQASAAPLSWHDFMQIFRNPWKDFIDSFPHIRQEENTKANASSDDNTDEYKVMQRMIKTPQNKIDCKYGLKRDLKGICRQIYE